MSGKENVKSFEVLKIFSNITSSKLFGILSFSILTAVAAQITIPVKPVPFTLQTMMVVLAGALLGAKKGAYSQLLYLMMGVAGLPVFAQVPDGAIGFARLFGPTGGYLLAFPVAAFLTGFMVERVKSYAAVTASMFIGAVSILILGSLYLGAFYLHNLAETIQAGAAVFSLWMVVKVFAASSVYFGIKKSGKK